VVPTLVGRSVEVSQVRALVDGLPGRGGTLVVRGEPGIGKTALVAEAIDAAVARRMLVLRAVGSEFESHLPYAALQQLCRSQRERVVRLRPRQRDAMEAAFGSGSAAAPDLYLVGLATLELLTEIGEERGVLVVVDDAHWIDGSTARVLAFVARRLEADPVALLVSLRAGYRSKLTDETLPRLDLGALSRAEAVALVETSRPQLVAAERQVVLELAQGNPLALLELAAAPDPSAGPAERRLTDRLQRAFSARVAGLDDQARRALLVAALHDGELISEVLAAASRLGGGPVGLDAGSYKHLRAHET
jgi:predicted ATPase